MAFGFKKNDKNPSISARAIIFILQNIFIHTLFSPNYESTGHRKPGKKHMILLSIFGLKKMKKNLTVEVAISQITNDDFVFSKDNSDVEEGQGIYTYWGSSSTVQEAMESLATNILSSGPSTEDKASSDSDDKLPLFEDGGEKYGDGVARVVEHMVSAWSPIRSVIHTKCDLNLNLNLEKINIEIYITNAALFNRLMLDQNTYIYLRNQTWRVSQVNKSI